MIVFFLFIRFLGRLPKRRVQREGSRSGQGSWGQMPISGGCRERITPAGSPRQRLGPTTTKGFSRVVIVGYNKGKALFVHPNPSATMDFPGI